MTWHLHLKIYSLELVGLKSQTTGTRGGGGLRVRDLESVSVGMKYLTWLT